MNKTQKKVQWNHLWSQQKRKCYYCRQMMRKEHGYPDSATFDHYIPKSALLRGYKDDAANLVLACRECNRLKGDTIPGEQGPVIRRGPYELVPNSGWKWVGAGREGYL